VKFFKVTLVVLLLLAVGTFILVTAVIIAYPILAHLAAKYFQ